MESFQIVAIRTSNDTHTMHITDVWLAGNTDKYTVASIVGWIDAGKYGFYTVGPGGIRAEVEVATTASGARYIRTKANKTTIDNLLSLPRR